MANSIYKKTGIKISAYNNFEAQKGKTKIDSHYAVLIFSFRAYTCRHEGHDVLSPKDIVNGTERLKGTNVYEISIDRTKEPRSAKTWQGITNYFSFVYKYNDNQECREIKAQEQTNVGPSVTLTKQQMNRLWTDLTLETGATTQFDLTRGMSKAPLIEKKKNIPPAPERPEQEQSLENYSNALKSQQGRKKQ